ncbi:974b7f38-177a-4927-b904-2cb6394c251c [Thermothielavioides terrestris]|uniref:Uncharacterized protein n=2 Tax=Thermothielavioides terrestris TaxID=2587410 RepID=G2RH48_THETT|nr:uncharacterized protein THITE_116498 [Thermothielavioides terrestris NRRL 8126]AEO71160.1 hypothetical protein THITE_116498 [Thermothielavioides terrestris NRRL 8126]SPQ20494.1 974b7f38-177a-4927-b904-2cb6394c251c [Thermothielavioides terrestris]
MEKLPAELYDAIVVQLHHDFCHCSSGYSRPSRWDAVHSYKVTNINLYGEWDFIISLNLKRELCDLRLVNRRFYTPATRILFSHFKLVLGYDCRPEWTFRQQARYCLADENRSLLGQITGLAINLPCITEDEFSVPGHRIRARVAAQHNFMRRLPSLVTRFDSVTALKIRVVAIRRPEWWQGLWLEDIIKFALSKLRNLTELHMISPWRSANTILESVPPQQCDRLRRLIVVHEHGCGRQLPPIARFKNLTELALRDMPPAPLRLHDQLRGLTRLQLERVCSAAAYFIAAMTGVPVPASSLSEDGESSGGVTSAPLTHLGLYDVELESVEEDGQIHEAGSWSLVFDTVRRRCRRLRTLWVDGVFYAHSFTHPTPSTQMTEADEEALKALAADVRSRPDGDARCQIRMQYGVYYDKTNRAV